MTIWWHIAAMLKRICMQNLCKRIKLLSGVEYLLQVETPIPTQSFWIPMQYPSLNIHHHHWSLTYLEELIVFNVDTKYGCYKRMVLLNPILPALQICGRISRDGHKQIQKNPDPLFLNNLHVPCLYPPICWMDEVSRERPGRCKGITLGQE